MGSKIFVCSDVHDDVEALTAFADYAQAEGPDHIFFLGDFSLRPYKPEDLETLVKSNDTEAFLKAKTSHNGAILEAMKEQLDGVGVQYTVLPGNYDGTLDEMFPSQNLHKKSAQLNEAKIFGYGGADAFPRHIGLLTQLGAIVPFDHNELYQDLVREQPDIAIIHNPPLSLCDDMFNGQNVGTPATTQYIMEYGPKLVLSGHIHEAGPLGNNPKNVKGVAGVKNRLGRSTLVVNPGNLGRFELVDFPSLATAREFDYGTFTQIELEDDGSPTKVTHYSLQETGRRVGQVRKLTEYDIPKQ